jgi:transporter family-2 protein
MLVILQVIIAIIGGIIAGIQAAFVGLLGQRLGTIESVFISFAGGAVVISLLLLGLGGGSLGRWQTVPWYALLAGPLGLLVIGAIGYTLPRLGVAPSLSLIVAAQLIAGAVFDHFGLWGAAAHPLTPTRLAGMAALFLGTWLVLR